MFAAEGVHSQLSGVVRCTHVSLAAGHPGQVLRHDIGEKKKVGTVSEAYPHLVLDNFTSKLGQRVGNILKYLFPCPKACSARCCDVRSSFPSQI